MTMRRQSGRFWWITLGMTASFLLGGWLAPRIRIEWNPGRLPNEAMAQAPRVAPIVGADEPVARAVSQVLDTVVNIDTVNRVVQDDWFFGRQEYRTTGAGSGVVIDTRGHVITNQHVVEGAEQIRVVFPNGRRFRGRVVGGDRDTDVALVQILNAGTLPAAQLGDSKRLVPGQWAIAIGNPYGYQHTVTVGVVGHTGRAVQVEDRLYSKLIQTDAAINPGNSGGPLVDIHGKVIGINTVVRSDAQGIGFAIPIDVAKGIADELLRSGRIKRPWIGLVAEDLTPRTARYLGRDSAEGCYVEQLNRRGPAAQAGVQPGDVIRSLGGRAVRRKQDVEAVVNGARIGQKLQIVLERQDGGYKGEIVVIEKP